MRKLVMRLIDLSGQRFGRLVVVRRDVTPVGRGPKWLCVCDCGAERIVPGENLRKGTARSCGCIRAADLSQMKFGRLFVLSRCSDHTSKGGGKRTKWLCSCECGSQISVLAQSLVNGNTKSCGCLNRDRNGPDVIHGHAGESPSPTYVSWCSMKARCNNPDWHGYHRYGGRGVKVCHRWARSFQAFLADMGERPDKCVLSRIDHDGDYEPGNVRWQLASENAKEARSRHQENRRAASL